MMDSWLSSARHIVVKLQKLIRWWDEMAVAERNEDEIARRNNMYMAILCMISVVVLMFALVLCGSSKSRRGGAAGGLGPHAPGSPGAVGGPQKKGWMTSVWSSDYADHYPWDMLPDPPYDPKTVKAEPLNSDSQSLTGRPCGKKKCTTLLVGGIYSLLVTRDHRLVMTCPMRRAVLVRSADHFDSIPIGAQPYGVTQIRDGRIAVPCLRDLQGFLALIDINNAQDNVRLIMTRKVYNVVAPGIEEGTLIVGSLIVHDGEVMSVDVINLHGFVLKTLTDNIRAPQLRNLFYSMSYYERDLIACVFSGKTNSSALLRIGLSNMNKPKVSEYKEKNLRNPMTVVADKRGNMFIGLENTVLFRTKNGNYRTLLTSPAKGLIFPAIALYGGTMFVAWSNPDTVQKDVRLVEYKLA